MGITPSLTPYRALRICLYTFQMDKISELRYTMTISKVQKCALSCGCGILLWQFLITTADQIKKGFMMHCPYHKQPHDLSLSPILKLVSTSFYDSVFNHSSSESVFSFPFSSLYS